MKTDFLMTYLYQTKEYQIIQIYYSTKISMERTILCKSTFTEKEVKDALNKLENNKTLGGL